MPLIVKNNVNKYESLYKAGLIMIIKLDFVRLKVNF